MIFSKSNIEKKKYRNKKLIKMEGIQIPFSDSVKFLGVTLDKKLTRKTHIEKSSIKEANGIVKQQSKKNESTKT